MTAAIVIPSIAVDPLLVRCVRECRRTCPDAEIIALVDEGEGREQIDDLATVLVTGPISIGAKRNLGGAKTSATYLAFIDSDAYPQEGWLDAATGFLDAHPEFGAVGGPNVSPPEEPPWERWVGLAHQSFLVAGWWAYRRDPLAAEREVTALPSCNVVVRRVDYEAVDGMNELLFTAEDTDFCRRFVAAGHRIWFAPEVLVFHKNRGLKAFVVQRFTFGVAMVPLLRDGTAPDAAYTAASGVIAAFVVFLALAPLALVWPWFGRVWRAVAGAYLAVVAVEAVRQARRLGDLPGTAVALLVGNLAPGAGFALKAVRLSPDLRGVYRNDG